MATDKRIKYQDTTPVVQGGVDNYLGKQPQVQAPRKWQSGPGKPPTELAYITQAEKDLILKGDLHGSLKKGPNMGPSGIMSLDSFGDIGGAGASGGDTSAGGGAMAGRGFSGQNTNTTSDRSFDKQKANQRATLQMAERAQSKNLGYNERQDISNFKSRPKSKWAGIGGLLKGALSIFGGIPGKLFSGIMTAKNWAKNKAIGIGDEVDEFSDYPTLDRYLNRNTDKYKDKPYLGQGKSNYSFDGPTEGNDLGLAVNRQKALIGPGLRVGQDQGYYGKGSQYDPNRFQNTNITGGTNLNDFQGVNFNNAIDETDYSNDPMYTNAMAKDGGRIGYRNGEFVEKLSWASPGGAAFNLGKKFASRSDPEEPGFDVNENIEMAEGKSPFELRIEELVDTGMSWQEAWKIASEEFGQIAQGESDQGIASIV